MTTATRPKTGAPRRTDLDAPEGSAPACKGCGTTGGPRHCDTGRAWRVHGLCRRCYQLNRQALFVPDCPNFLRLANERLTVLEPRFTPAPSVATRLLVSRTRRALRYAGGPTR